MSCISVRPAELSQIQSSTLALVALAINLGHFGVFCVIKIVVEKSNKKVKRTNEPAAKKFREIRGARHLPRSAACSSPTTSDNSPLAV